jgi:hypothetical protein
MLKCIVTILFIYCSINSIESIANLYRHQNLATFRSEIVTKWQTGSTITDVPTLGKCMRYCTKKEECEAGQYNRGTLQCKLLKYKPIIIDIISVSNRVIFFRGN